MVEITSTDWLAESRGEEFEEFGGGELAGESLKQKRRVYIDDAGEAPDDADVQEGDQGGLYYETETVGSDEDNVETGPDEMVQIDAEDVESGDYVSVGPAEGFVKEIEAVGGKAKVSFGDGTELLLEETADVFIDDGRDFENYQATEGERLAEEVTITEWPDRGDGIDRGQARMTMGAIADRTKNMDVMEEVYSNVTVEDDSNGSFWSETQQKVIIDSKGTDNVLAHEFGHATVGVYGAGVENVTAAAASFYDGSAPEMEIGQDAMDYLEEKLDEEYANRAVPSQAQRIKEEKLENMRDEFGGQTFEREDFLLTGAGDAPEEVENLIEAANAAWERQFDNTDGGEATEYRIGKPYSAYNAHETLAMTHEVMQGGSVDRQTMENLMTEHEDLLEAYLELFEPNESARQIMNIAFDEVGPNAVFEDTPYPDAEAEIIQ